MSLYPGSVTEVPQGKEREWIYVTLGKLLTLSSSFFFFFFANASAIIIYRWGSMSGLNELTLKTLGPILCPWYVQ